MTLEDILNSLINVSLSLSRLIGEVSCAVENASSHNYLKFVKCEKADTDEQQKRSINNER